MTEIIFSSTASPNLFAIERSQAITDLKNLNVIISKISVCLTVFICLVGIVGNLISLKVFSSTKLPRTSSRTYLITLTLIDSVFLLVHFLDNTCREMVEYFKLDFPFNITDQKETICRSFALIRSTCRCASPWIIVAFTLERFIVVYFPNYTNAISKTYLARRLIYIILIMSVVVSLYSPILSGIILDPTRKLINTTSPYSIFVNLFEKKPKKSIELEQMFFKRSCDILADYRSLYLYLTLFYTIMVIVLPLVIISVFNTFLILRLYRTTDQWTSAKLKIHEQEMSYKELRDKKVQIENSKVTWMLIIISVTFIVLTLPHAVIYFTISLSKLKRLFVSRSTHVLLLIMKFTELLYLSNHSINFFLYILTRNSFRKMFKEKFYCFTTKKMYINENENTCLNINNIVNMNKAQSINIKKSSPPIKTTNISNIKWLPENMVYMGNSIDDKNLRINAKNSIEDCKSITKVLNQH